MQQLVEEISPKRPIEEDALDDFSFVCLNPDGSPISAEEAFVNGQIRPVFPMFDPRILPDVNETTPVRVRPQLKKLFGGISLFD